MRAVLLLVHVSLKMYTTQMIPFVKVSAGVGMKGSGNAFIIASPLTSKFRKYAAATNE
jgi:hypothetical protein